MKYFVLILKEFNQFPKVIQSCKKNPFQMVLKYFRDNNIKKILKTNECNPVSLADGKYLVSVGGSKTEFLTWDVKNIGWVFDNIAWNKVDRLNIQEIEILDKEDDDIQTAVMSELTARYSKFEL